MRFDRQDNGRITEPCFGAHTYRRTAFGGDYTGLALQRAPGDRASRLNIPVPSTAYINEPAV